MSLKWKFLLGTGLLYIIMVGCVALCLLSVKRLSDAGTKVIRDNYRSLEYMQRIDSLIGVPAGSVSDYNANLHQIQALVALQARNVTEKGEAEATARLKAAARLLPQSASSSKSQASFLDLMRAADQIEALNLRAIRSKSEAAEAKAGSLLNESVVATTLAFLFVFTFLISFPRAIITPLEELTRLIGRVAAGDFSQRADEGRTDELGTLAKAFNSMSADLERYRQSNLERLMAAQRRTETIINRLPDPLIVADAGWNILFFNQAAQTVLGLKPTEIQGRSLTDMAARNDLLRTWIEPFGEGGARDRLAALPVVVEGKERYYEPDAITIQAPNDEGGVMGYVLSLTDVTHFKELDRAKTDFLATISHELKTPLSSIDLSLRLLRNPKTGSLTDGQDKIIQGIDAENQRLMRLVSELLNQSQLETGRLSLQPRATHVAALVSQATAAVRIAAEGRQVAVELQLNADLPSVAIDPEKTGWVLINLLTNALKHTEAGHSIELSGRLAGNEVILAVANPGGPMQLDAQDARFARYAPTDGRQLGTLASSGLGLSISQEIMQAQGGRIWIHQSNPNQTKIAIALPVADQRGEAG